MRNFNEIGLPAPNQYEDWRSWASALMVALDGMSGEETINFPLYVRDSSKARDGLPVGADGDTIRVKDADGKIRLYTFSDNAWKESTPEPEAVDISGKADTDLGNLLPAGYARLLENYQNGTDELTTIPWGQTFTVPKLGQVFGYTGRANDNSSAFYINGIRLGYSISYWSNIPYSGIVFPGDTVLFDGGSTNTGNIAYFIPFKVKESTDEST